jgi:hypothetical protein
MLDRTKKYFTKDKNSRDKLRCQEIIIETLMLEISKSEEQYKLFKFILENVVFDINSGANNFVNPNINNMIVFFIN